MDAFERYRASRKGPRSKGIIEWVVVLAVLGGAVGAWVQAAPLLTNRITPEVRTKAKATMPDGVLTIVQLDVGQGDATFIHTPDGKNILIDCGEGAHAENQFSRQYAATVEVVIPFLEMHGIYTIDRLILTHPDSDHGGGMAELIDWIYSKGGKVDMMIDGGMKKGAHFYKQLLNTILEHEDIEYLTVLEPKGKGRVEHPAGLFKDFEGGDLLGVDILADPLIALQIMGPVKKLGDANDNSVITRIQYGDFSFLSAGDAEDHQEDDTVRFWGPGLKSQLHFGPHHGSKTSDHPWWLKFVNPEIMSTSSHPPVFGHPAPEVLKNWKEHISPPLKLFLRTDINGDIWFRSDGTKLSIRTQFKYEGEESQWVPAERKAWKKYRNFEPNPPTTWADCYPVPGTDSFN